MKSKMIRLSATLIFFLSFLQSCAPVRLIGESDEIVTKTTTQLQEKVTVLLVKIERNLGTEKAKYEYYTEYYDNIKVDLNNVEIRAAALTKYELIYKQILEIKKLTHNLEMLHQMGFSSVDEINLLRNTLNPAFTAIIKLQTELKRGKK